MDAGCRLGEKWRGAEEGKEGEICLICKMNRSLKIKYYKCKAMGIFYLQNLSVRASPMILGCVQMMSEAFNDKNIKAFWQRLIDNDNYRK